MSGARETDRCHYYKPYTSVVGFADQICRDSRDLHKQVAMSKRNVAAAVTAGRSAATVIGIAALSGTESYAILSVQ